MTVKGIKVRQFKFCDIEERVKLINNPKIHSHMYFDLPATIQKTQKWFNKKDNYRRSDFTFINKKDNVIGMSGITNFDEYNSKAEFYVMVSPAYQGMGYGTSISKWTFNYGFLVFNLNKLFLFTDNDNPPSYRIYEKAGFKLEGILRQHSKKDGIYRDRRLYGLLQEEWIQLPWKRNKIVYEL